MILSRTTPCQKFTIKMPIWDGRKVGLATYKIGQHNEIEILAKNSYGDRIYPRTFYISGDNAKTYPIKALKNNPNITIYEIPISKLDILERN